jgi:hypothetical protein
MSKTVEFTSVKPSEVRAFAKEHNIPVGSKGRFNADLIAAFNKGKRGPKRYDETKDYAPHVLCVGKVKGKPPVRKVVAVPVLRAAALAAKAPIGERGRIPEEVKAAYATGTLHLLAPQ